MDFYKLINIIKNNKLFDRKPTFIDLFCGCGGITQGFVDAGYKLLLGIDHDQPSIDTFNKNFEMNGRNIDLFKDNYIKEIHNNIFNNDIDVVLAGPPCQGFSLTGPRNFDDPRNSLYLSVFNTVEHFQPKAFLIENVKGMKTLYKGQILKEVLNRFKKLGYIVANPEILLAANFGVPQMRERLFIIGVREDYSCFKFPDAVTNEKKISCEDAIGDLPSREKDLGFEKDFYSIDPITDYQKFMRYYSDNLFNHVATRHTELVKSVISQVPEGKNHKALPPGVGDSRKFNEAWTRYHSKKPSKTIDTGHRNHFHYKWNRVPTVRENARLQSFRDDFIFLGPRTQQNKQVGNAVPPLLAYFLATKIKDVIEKN